MRAILVSDGIIVNRILAGEGYIPPAGFTVHPESEAGDFTDPQAQPAPADPVPVSPRQFRLELLSRGLLSRVESTLDAMPEPQRSGAKIEWEFSQEVRPDHPLVLALAGAFGLSAADVSAIFLSAAQR